MNELKKQTVSGIKWQVSSSFLTRAITFIATIVVARILNPSIFGLYALAFVAIDALGLFKSMGFDSALIQRKENIEKAANTAFFIIPALGTLVYLTLVFSAPSIGKFLNNQEVIGVIRALGIVFVISCFGKVPAALLEKTMQFKKVSIIEIITAVVYSLSVIIFAIIGMGIWSLVIAYILKTLNYNVMVWVFSKWHPKFEFDKKIALEMFHFGKFIFLGSIVWFLRMNLNNILVGKLLGVAALGLYAIAFNIANFSADYFGGKVNRVVFPAYSKLQGDLDDLRSASLKVFKHVSLIALPLGIGFLLLGKELLKLTYGDKWISATGVLKILAWAGVFNTLVAALVGIFLACGKPKFEFLINSLQVAIFFLFVAPLAKKFGINGVAMVVTVSSFIAFIVTLGLVIKLLSLNFKQIYLSLRPSLISSLIMASGIVIFKNIALRAGMPNLFYYNAIILFMLATLIYGYSLFKVEVGLIKEIKELIF